ncbi:hypothetical protein B0H21DRAFT_493666 [Amylocystis lapponica]|nr:hypothetical protein B0H21DRAFT_493666 [Amylocystis lapponica]
MFIRSGCNDSYPESRRPAAISPVCRGPPPMATFLFRSSPSSNRMPLSSTPPPYLEATLYSADGEFGHPCICPCRAPDGKVVVYIKSGEKDGIPIRPRVKHPHIQRIDRRLVWVHPQLADESTTTPPKWQAQTNRPNRRSPHISATLGPLARGPPCRRTDTAPRPPPPFRASSLPALHPRTPSHHSSSRRGTTTPCSLLWEVGPRRRATHRPTARRRGAGR